MGIPHQAWQRALEDYRRWDATHWTLDEARQAKRLYEEFWRFAAPTGESILDVGGARGLNREWLSGQRYAVVDPDADWIIAPRHTFMRRLYRCFDEPFVFIRGIAETLPIASASFDHVVMQAVLDHCADPSLAVGEAHRVLRMRDTSHHDANRRRAAA